MDLFIAEWNFKSGFLLKKSKWTKTWNLRWVVLDARVLITYTDESQTVETGKFKIDEDTVIETMDPEEEKKFIFTIFNSNSSRQDNLCPLILCAEDSLMIESWMIYLIQSSLGPYRPSENFSENEIKMNEEQNIEIKLPNLENGIEPSNLSDKASDQNYALLDPNISHIKLKFPISDYLLCRDTCGLWRKKYFILDETAIIRGYKNTDNLEVMTVARYINRGTRVIKLPKGFESQLYSFALITSFNLDRKTNYCINQTLRFSVYNEKDLLLWMMAIQYVIEYDSLDRQQVVNLPHTLQTKSLKMRAARLTVPLSFPNTESRTAFYINDDTVWGAIYRVDEQDPVAIKAMNHLYRKYFTIPFDATSEDTLVVSVFENQRYLPFNGWSALHLLPGDPATLSDRLGVKFPNRYLKRTEPPNGYYWPLTVTDHGNEVSNEWTTAQCFGGWLYSKQFASFERDSTQHLVHLVPQRCCYMRRRKWIRFAYRISSTDSSSYNHCSVDSMAHATVDDLNSVASDSASELQPLNTSHASDA